MTHVSLFTGIGGLDLAAEWAGFETILQVEREPYALRVLEKHWPDVPRIHDVREVTSESVSGPVTVVSGGFPCQPFSAAGKRRGVEDDRYLWPQLLRIVEELRPAWVIGENVSGLLSIDGGMEIDRMLAALEARDYTPWVLHYPAASVGAPHKRDRVFIVAHARDGGHRESIQPVGQSRGYEPSDTWSDGTIQFMAHTARELSHGSGREGRRRAELANGGGAISNQWESEPDVGRVATGVPHRVDRLRALGNAVVPQQAYPIFAAIAAQEGRL